MYFESSIFTLQDQGELPEGVDPASVINIVGVVTDVTGVVGLITEAYSGTVPARSPGTTSPTPAPYNSQAQDTSLNLDAIKFWKWVRFLEGNRLYKVFFQLVVKLLFGTKPSVQSRSFTFLLIRKSD